MGDDSYFNLHIYTNWCVCMLMRHFILKFFFNIHYCWQMNFRWNWWELFLYQTVMSEKNFFLKKIKSEIKQFCFSFCFYFTECWFRLCFFIVFFCSIIKCERRCYVKYFLYRLWVCIWRDCELIYVYNFS